MPGPIKPSEVEKAKAKTIPEEVFRGFNEMIAKKWNGYSATFTLKDVADHVVSLMDKETTTRQTLFDNNWMDVEPIYRKAGWKVEFDKPGYNETYDANFTFSKKGSRYE